MSTAPVKILNERSVETPVGTVFITSIETDTGKIKTRAKLVREHCLTVSMPVYNKSKADVIRETETAALRHLMIGIIIPRDLVDITRELNVLLMECIISSPDSAQLEDIKIRRMDLTNRLAKLQEIARRGYGNGDTGPADDQG